MGADKVTNNTIPYGYKRDPEDKNHLLIDEEAAKVVHRIFQMIIDGMGTKAIAKIFYSFSPVFNLLTRAASSKRL